MEIIFIDYENISLLTLEETEINSSDKVFIFSNEPKARKYAEDNNCICHDKYPEGGNQADFYIIACLVKELLSASELEKKTTVFALHTRDKDLVTAFKFQCELFGCQSKNVLFVYVEPPKKPRKPKLPKVEQTEQEKEELQKKAQD